VPGLERRSARFGETQCPVWRDAVPGLERRNLNQPLDIQRFIAPRLNRLIDFVKTTTTT
jgi:hypothetical protein